jgi:hypothetical protein
MAYADCAVPSACDVDFLASLPLVAPWMLVHYKRSVRCGYVCRIRVVVGVCATLSDESGLVGLCAHAPLSARV